MDTQPNRGTKEEYTAFHYLVDHAEAGFEKMEFDVPVGRSQLDFLEDARAFLIEQYGEDNVSNVNFYGTNKQTVGLLVRTKTLNSEK